MSYFATDALLPGVPVTSRTTFRFDHEEDRDAWVSDAPWLRRVCDAPDDGSGFHQNRVSAGGRVVRCDVRNDVLPEAMTDHAR